MLSRGDAVGLFQLESSGMRSLLQKLKPHCLEDIISVISLYRPGPADSIDTFLENRRDMTKVKPHQLSTQRASDSCKMRLRNS